jgi:ABC-type amino acid transport substrate-binding protein
MKSALFALGFLILGLSHAQAEDVALSGYERVMKTRTLRCAYNALPPYITVDPATKKIDGPIYTITNDIGERLGVKVEWNEEAGYGEIAAGLASGRYDAFCGLLWQTPARAGAMAFTAPLYKSKVYPCVRADTTAYDKTTDALNAASVTFAGYDGDVSYQTPRQIFPLARMAAIPANMSFGEALQGIVAKKYDAIATCSPVVVDNFNKANGNVLKIAAPEHPITVVPIVLGVGIDDMRLKNMMDVAIFEMNADGTLEKHLRRDLNKYIDNTIILPKPY